MSRSRNGGVERPPASSRAGRSWRFALLALAAVCIVLAVAVYIVVSVRATDRGADTLTAVEATPSWRGPDSELGTRGSVVVEGVELRAGEVQCGLPRHDWKGGSASASGQFCVIDVEVRNAGAAPLAVAPSVFALLDGDGARAVADERLTAYGSGAPGGSPGAQQLPVGGATRIHVVFDVAAGAPGPMTLQFTPSAELTITL